jgi:hypothetical protein
MISGVITIHIDKIKGIKNPPEGAMHNGPEQEIFLSVRREGY